jgi:asparagine synthase (glutamine-hydrolysing)
VCGIAGIYRLGERPPGPAEQADDRARVARMLGTIEYRGPDDAGLESVGRATLGVRRLSILDVASGHQPLSDAAGRVWAMQNGEIYNFPALRRELAVRHAFRSHTDTEVLPYLWAEHGPALPSRLRGMFALAVYDSGTEQLFLARDALGVKPLYWARTGDRLLFASELKALLCDPDLPRVLDPSRVARYLALGFVPGAGTVFRDVHRVRPGCALLADPRGVRHERWWPWPRFFAGQADRPATVEGMADEVGRRLSESAQAMLLSDRPLGVLLSGGIDSSLLLALLPEEVRHETRTFTIGFENGGHHDERAIARRVAAHLGTRHHESTVALDVAATLPFVMGRLDEPCADPAAVPAHLVARAASEHVTVLLSGTGGDEVFGGYRRYRLPSLLARLGWLPRSAAALGARLLADRDQHRSTRTGERLIMVRKLLEARAHPTFFDAYLSTLAPAAAMRWHEAVALDGAARPVGGELWPELVDELAGPPEDDAAAAFAVDHLWYLPDDLLLKEDRMTMAASVEGRVPFLDADLVAYAAGLPLDSRFEGGAGKRVLRTLARRLLPDEVTRRGKHGFSVPIEEWLRGPLDTLLGDVIASADSGLFRRDALRRLHDDHRARRDRSGALWTALSWELWWRAVGGASPERIVADGAPLAGTARALPAGRAS